MKLTKIFTMLFLMLCVCRFDGTFAASNSGMSIAQWYRNPARWTQWEISAAMGYISLDKFEPVNMNYMRWAFYTAVQEWLENYHQLLKGHSGVLMSISPAALTADLEKILNPSVGISPDGIWQAWAKIALLKEQGEDVTLYKQRLIAKVESKNRAELKQVKVGENVEQAAQAREYLYVAASNAKAAEEESKKKLEETNQQLAAAKTVHEKLALENDQFKKTSPADQTERIKEIVQLTIDVKRLSEQDGNNQAKIKDLEKQNKELRDRVDTLIKPLPQGSAGVDGEAVKRLQVQLEEKEKELQKYDQKCDELRKKYHAEKSAREKLADNPEQKAEGDKRVMEAMLNQLNEENSQIKEENNQMRDALTEASTLLEQQAASHAAENKPVPQAVPGDQPSAENVQELHELENKYKNLEEMYDSLDARADQMRLENRELKKMIQEVFGRINGLMNIAAQAAPYLATMPQLGQNSPLRKMQEYLTGFVSIMSTFVDQAPEESKDKEKAQQGDDEHEDGDGDQ